jgi:hypothetical protein
LCQRINFRIYAVAKKEIYHVVRNVAKNMQMIVMSTTVALIKMNTLFFSPADMKYTKRKFAFLSLNLN